MKLIHLLTLGVLLIACKNAEKPTNNLFKNSNQTIQVSFNLDKKKAPFYKIMYEDKTILDTSYLGIIREDGNFSKNLKLLHISNGKEISETYSMLQGKQKEITYKALQYEVALENEQGKKMNILFNVSDDGVAFKYVFPEKSEDVKKITTEITNYNFGANTKAWLQPMSKAKTGWESSNPSYEEHYQMEIPIDKKSPINEGWVYPALFNTDSIWVVISEANLKSNYCGTRLKYNDSMKALQVTFPQKEEVFPDGALNPESQTPWETPWRLITIGDLKTVMESTLGTDLAEPAISINTDFVQGGLSSWSWVLLKDDFTNYETSKKFIDYASDMNWKYCLIDCDWDQKIGYDKMKELADYAKSKRVNLLVWYNSAGSWNTTPYTPRNKMLTHDVRTSEFGKLKDMGISGVKIDFFGGDGQSMIAYYHEILKDAAEYQLFVNFHGTTLPRGWQRTYPNLMTMESIKGEEFITFEQVNADLQPSHCAILPFTRNLFDPMDFTPMVLDSISGIERKTTKAFELALPILFTSGVQHIAEIPEGMAKQPDYVVEFLKNIPVNWDESKFITGYPGKDVIIARRYKNSWFVVGINGEDKEKLLKFDISFIEKEIGYHITDSEENNFKKTDVNPKTIKSVKLQPNGGFVMVF